MLLRRLPDTAVRLATAADINVVGSIAYRAFQHSLWFPFERQYNDKYPKDAERAYRQEYEKNLSNNQQLFTVYEIERQARGDDEDESAGLVVDLAVWNPAEGSPSIKTSIQDNTGAQETQGSSEQRAIGASEKDSPAPGGGLVAWIKSSLPCHGPAHPKDDQSEDRTADPYRQKLLSDACDKARDKYFPGQMELDNMAVDPDYWRHGYASRLCEHGMQIAKDERTSIGILAAGSGVRLYKAMGFCDLEKDVVKDDRDGQKASTDFTVFKWPHLSKL